MFVQIYLLTFPVICDIIYLSRRDTDTQSKRIEKTETKKFLKIFKKSLDKQYQIWYNKNVAKRESKVPLTHLFTI